LRKRERERERERWKEGGRDSRESVSPEETKEQVLGRRNEEFLTRLGRLCNSFPHLLLKREKKDASREDDRQRP
jgi:hypothetical protein